MGDIFRSDRLVYIPVEKDEKLDKVLHGLDKEPSTINSHARLSNGVGRANVERLHDWLGQTKMVALYVCLPGSASSSSSAEPTPIGLISLTNSDEMTRHHACASMGLILSSAHQGQGYGSEAIRWMLWWAFTMARLHRVEISCNGWNRGALRLYRRLGFVLEGTRRQSVWFMGTWHDSHYLSLLESEWAALRKEQGHDDAMTTDKVAEFMRCA